MSRGFNISKGGAQYSDSEDTCFSSGPAAQFKRVMSYYEGGSFITWRWSSVVNVVSALLKRRGALKAGFDSQKFGGGPDSVSDGLGDSGRKSKFVIDSRFVNAVNAAICSPLFWSYCELVDCLAGTLDSQSSYCEGCDCHGHMGQNSWRSRTRAIARSLHRDAGRSGPS